jgi:transcriptional regulator with XRE-family HTH domain
MDELQYHKYKEPFWKTIDMIADQRGKTLPKLALEAGLDQSTFSHARRKRNWMSLKTLAKVLDRYDISLTEWAKMVEANSKN